MGDYSRDPVTRLADSAQKHYVGVRLQQGVPLLDADWNELEDLRKHEMYEFVRRFIGDGVPDGNDGFRIQSLEGGAIGNIILQADSTTTELTSIEVVLASSTAADRLGFLPGNTYSERFGDSPAQLSGDATEPYILSDGLTFSVRVNGTAEQTVTFVAADFADINQATAAEVQAVLAAGLLGMTSRVGSGNDFTILGGNGTVETAGRILAEGVEVMVENSFMFQSQPLYQNTALATEWGVDPVAAISAVAADRQDLVYLDVWEREIGYEEDEDIVQTSIGIETAKRLRREWAVRVAEGATDLSSITRQAGHKYTPLAQLQRLAATAEAINPEQVYDLRRTQINIAKYLKTPIHVIQGSTVVTAQDFAELLETLHAILLRRYRERVFDFHYDPLDTTGYNESIIRQAIESILNFTQFSAAQARAGNYNNTDGLRVFSDLYTLQSDFVDVVTTYGHHGSETTTQNFIDGYTTRLDDPTTGLEPATTNNDMIGSMAAQQEINTWLSLPIGELPEGSVVVSIDDIQPETNLAFNVPFNITYQIESRLSSTRLQEDFLISVESTSPIPWDFDLSTEDLTLVADGGLGEVVLTVTPRSGAASAEFALTVVAARNEAMVNMTHTSPVFQIGLPPAGGDILQWVSPALNESGRVPFTQFMFQLGAGQVNFEIGLNNTSTTGATQRYELSYHVIAPTGEEASWLPAVAAPATQEVDVADGATETLILTLTGPNPPAAGGAGTIVLQATLLLEDSLPPAEASVTNLEVGFDISA